MPSPQRLLAIYAADHDAGATAHVELLRRAASARSSKPDGAVLASMADEVVADRALLREQLARVGAHPSRLKTTGAWLGEKLGRLKLNGSVTAPSPLGHVVDLEAVMTLDGFTALAWRTVLGQAGVDERLDAAVATSALARHDIRIGTLLGLRGERSTEAFRAAG